MSNPDHIERILHAQVRRDIVDDLQYRLDSGPAPKPLPKMTINLTSLIKSLMRIFKKC